MYDSQWRLVWVQPILIIGHHKSKSKSNFKERRDGSVEEQRSRYREVPGSKPNQCTSALWLGINPHFQIPQRGLQAVCPLVAILQAHTSFLSSQVTKPNQTIYHLKISYMYIVDWCSDKKKSFNIESFMTSLSFYNFKSLSRIKNDETCI